MTPRYKGHIALMLANILFGMNFSMFATITKNYMSFENLFLARILVAALFFTPFIFFWDKYKIPRDDMWRIFGVALLIIFGKEFLLLWGSGRTSPIDASTLATLSPVITIGLALKINKLKVSTYNLIGIISATTGAIILLTHFVGESIAVLGNILILGSTIAAASNTVFIRPVLERNPLPVVLGWCYLFGAIVALPFFGEGLFTTNFAAIPSKGLIDIFIVLSVGTILPNYLLYYGTGHLTSVHTGLYHYLQPIVATTLTLWRGEETLGVYNIVSAAFIFVGVVFVVVNYRKFGFPPLLYSKYNDTQDIK